MLGWYRRLMPFVCLFSFSGNTFRGKLEVSGRLFSVRFLKLYRNPWACWKIHRPVLCTEERQNFMRIKMCCVSGWLPLFYIPKSTRCPMELSTYFRINEQNNRFSFKNALDSLQMKAVMSVIWRFVPHHSEMKTNCMHAVRWKLVAMDKNAEIKYFYRQNVSTRWKTAKRYYQLRYPTMDICHLPAPKISVGLSSRDRLRLLLEYPSCNSWKEINT